MVAEPNHYQHQRREALKQKTDKLLAEWFWTDRWMGSSAFLLPLEPRGLYREMLTQAWRRGAALPNDHAAIQNATGCKPAEWRRCWPKIEKYWEVRGDVLVNVTQLEVYAEAKAGKDAASNRGKKGAQATAQARAQALHKHDPSGAQAALEHHPPSPSLKPTTERKTESATVVAAAGKRTWLTPYADAWTARFGGKPAGGALAAALRPLTRDHDAATILSRWQRYLAENEAKYANPARFAATFGDWDPKAHRGIVQGVSATARVTPEIIPPSAEERERLARDLAAYNAGTLPKPGEVPA